MGGGAAVELCQRASPLRRHSTFTRSDKALNCSTQKQPSMTHHIRKVTLKATAGTGWNALQEQLDTVHEEVRFLAISGGRNGVLVTRHSHGTYTVAVSPEVPYGMTYERDDPGTP
jgi:hypothetical protein